MQHKTSSLKLIAFSMLFAVSTTAHSFSLLGTRAWDNITPNTTTRDIGTIRPGGATWSIIGAGISTSTSAHIAEAIHDDGSATTTSLDNLSTSFNITDITSIINNAFDIWASVSGFVNLGQVDPDSGVDFGAPETGTFGNIRIGAIAFDGAVRLDPDDSTRLIGTTLAHAYSPGGGIGGDIHIDNAETWVSGGSGFSSFDLATVLLHEIGHSLGLGHSSDPDSVLYRFYQGPNLTLGADDILGIQTIYGPAAVVPLPAAPLLFLSAMGLIGFVRRKRVAVTS